MNAADLVIWVILLIGFCSGLVRGFVRGLLGLVGLFLGIMLAAGHYERLATDVFSFIPVRPARVSSASSRSSWQS